MRVRDGRHWRKHLQGLDSFIFSRKLRSSNRSPAGYSSRCRRECVRHGSQRPPLLHGRGEREVQMQQPWVDDEQGQGLPREETVLFSRNGRNFSAVTSPGHRLRARSASFSISGSLSSSNGNKHEAGAPRMPTAQAAFRRAVFPRGKSVDEEWYVRLGTRNDERHCGCTGDLVVRIAKPVREELLSGKSLVAGELTNRRGARLDGAARCCAARAASFASTGRPRASAPRRG